MRHAALHVADRALNRVLGYPPGHVIEGEGRTVLDQTRAWFHGQVQPWSATVEHEISRVGGSGGAEVVLDGTTLRGPALARRIQRSGACIGVVVGVSLGAEVDLRIEQLWAEDRPDLAFFLDAYASLAVGRLMQRTAREVADRKRPHGLTVLPHTSPGYDGWPLEDQAALFGLLERGTPELEAPPMDGHLRLLDSGMLAPRKSLLGLLPVTADLGPLALDVLRTSCRSCSMPACAHRSMPMDEVPAR